MARYPLIGRFFLRVCMLLVCTGLGACTPRIDQRGKAPNPEKLASVQPGVHTQEDVMRLLGSPSYTTPFPNDTWYYIHKKTKTVAFFEPQILEQEVVWVTFDSGGHVKKIHRHDAQGPPIEPVKRKTHVPNQDKSWGEQVLGSFGRLGQKEKGSSRS